MDGEVVGPIRRNLGEYDVFVRCNARAVSILQKVLGHGEATIITILACSDKEFGWTSNFDGFHEKERSGDVPLYYIRQMKRDVGYIGRKAVTKSDHLIDTWKLLVPKAFNGGDAVPHQDIGQTVDCSVAISLHPDVPIFATLAHSRRPRVSSRIYTTRFFRFLVSVRKITQDATHSTYVWCRCRHVDRTWTDEDLYAKYGITRKEQAYIESQVRVMNLGDGDDE